MKTALSSIFTKQWTSSYVLYLTITPDIFDLFFFVQKTLVRLGAYQSLDLKISEALNQRSPDFPGVVVCSSSDSLGTFLQLLKLRRVHRLVVVEGEVSNASLQLVDSFLIRAYLQDEERRGGKKGRLMGIITLSDILRYIIGRAHLGNEIDQAVKKSTSDPTLKRSSARTM